MDFSGSRTNDIKKSLSCPICEKPFRQLTTIEICCRQFCHNCITKNIMEEGKYNCPECNADLGPTPLRSLRTDVNFEDAGITSILQQSAELLERHRVEEVPVLFAPRTRKSNRRKLVGEGSNNKHEENGTFWFCLVASDQQKNTSPLEQIPSKFLRVKDGSMTISCIKKYLVQKLHLHSEDEVEITLEGRKLLPSLQLYKLMDFWLQTKATLGKKTVSVGSSAEEFVMTLTYGRKPDFS